MAISCNGSNDQKLDQPPYYLPYELSSLIEFAEGEITSNNGINFSKDGKSLFISNPIEKTFENGGMLEEKAASRRISKKVG